MQMQYDGDPVVYGSPEEKQKVLHAAYAAVCCRMLKYADVQRRSRRCFMLRMLTYADLC
jgi:hypothetical protein